MHVLMRCILLSNKILDRNIDERSRQNTKPTTINKNGRAVHVRFDYKIHFNNMRDMDCYCG